MRKEKPSQPISRDMRRWRRRKPDRTRSTDHLKDTPIAEAGTHHSSIRAGFAVIGGRAAGALSRRLHMGGGTSVVGIVAQRLYPDIISHLASQLEHGSVVITGTNGKTTTSGLVASILESAHMRVWRNREGSNLTRGIAGSLVMRAQPNGELRGHGKAISVLEVDEAVIPLIVKPTRPRVMVFNNLFRDQLDRYGEVDAVSSRWREAIKGLTPETTLVLNADDPSIAQLGEDHKGPVIYFGIDDPNLNLGDQDLPSQRHQVIDTRACSRCGSEYTYTMRFFSHMGHYSCPNCGYTRPEPRVRALRIETDSFERTRLTVAVDGEQHQLVVPLPGIYNAYNALAAITASHALNLDWQAVVTGIERFQPAFGRGESIEANGRTIRILLAKNPTGFNEVLRTLFTDEEPKHTFLVLNDNTADGKDISWIWDVDYERATGRTKSLVIGGLRALDLGVRMKYAGVPEEQMVIVPPAPLRAQKLENEASTGRSRGHRKNNQETLPETGTAIETLERPNESGTPKLYGIASALDEAIRLTPEGQTLFIVPTYTGMLAVRKILAERGLAPQYWEG